MKNDPIVKEVRTHRAAIAREHGNDLRSIVTALRKKQGLDGRPVVSFARKPTPTRIGKRKTP